MHKQNIFHLNYDNLNKGKCNISNDETDYLKQFEILKNFVRSQSNENDDLEQLIFPIFVYLCIDLVSMGFSIKEFVM